MGPPARFQDLADGGDDGCPDSWEDLATDAPSDSDEVAAAHSAQLTESETSSEEEPEERASKSGHSRARKDLVNLNKAVSRWLVQLSENELSQDEIEERIRMSAVAKHLAT